MGPYSHYVIANLLENTIQPEDASEYYWGAVAPDVRYLLPGMNRNHTHLPSQSISATMDVYPQLKDFLRGYLVHCLSDDINILHIIKRKIPYKFQKNGLTKRQGTIILEFFNILRVKPAKVPISGGNNAFLKSLGIGDQIAAKYTKEINRFVTSPTIRSTLNLYQVLGFAGDDVFERYKKAAVVFQKNWLQKNLILFGLQVGKVNIEIASSVLSLYPHTKV